MARLERTQIVRSIEPDVKLYCPTGMISRDVSVKASADLPVGTILLAGADGVYTPVATGAAATLDGRIGVLIEKVTKPTSGNATARVLLSGKVYTLGVIEYGGYTLGKEFSQDDLETAGGVSNITFILEEDAR